MKKRKRGGEKMWKKNKIAVWILAFFLSFVFSATVQANLSVQDIQNLRVELKAQGATFKVGTNSATERDINELCGLVPPENWWVNAPFKEIKPKMVLPSSWNWCDQGKCTPVRDQGACGSCWAFGTVGPLESNILILDNSQEDLSEQYLVSCNTNGWGCDGGWWAHDYHEWKFSSPETEAGAVPENEFPYVATDVACGGPYSHPWKINDWNFIGAEVPPADAIKQAIIDYGPVSAAVHVGPAFQAYNGGIFNTNETGEINHAIVLVGWDDNQGANGVWFLRNSWGPNWGENGYMRIEYGTSQVGYSANYIDYSMSGDPDIAVSPTSLEITMPSDATAELVLNISNVGDADLIVSNICDEEVVVANKSSTILSDENKVLEIKSNDVDRYMNKQQQANGNFQKIDLSSNEILENFQNGGFEAGDFSGWAAGDNGIEPLTFWSVGQANTIGWFINNDPIEGQYDAVNGFDGDAGYEAYLYQDVQVPINGGIISLYDRIQYDSLDIASTLPRIYEIQIRNLNDDILEVLHHQEVMLDGQPYTDLGWQQRVFDISQFSGQTIRVYVWLFVPESWTGPAQIEFDDFVITGDGQPCQCGADASWMSASPTSGTVNPGGSMAVTVTFDTTGMSEGTYYGNIKIASNDPDEPCVVVPVTMMPPPCPPPGCVEDDSGTLDIGRSAGTPGSAVTIPVRIQSSPNTVGSLGFEVTFNSCVLDYTGFDRGVLVNDFDFFDCVIPAGENSIVRCGGFKATGGIATGDSGDVIGLNFNVIDCEPGLFYTLDLQELKDDISSWPISLGCFQCGCSCDINGNGEVTPQDALCAFQKYLGICPTDCGQCEEICCDVNGDGDCTPADALEIFKEYLAIVPNACSSEL